MAARHYRRAMARLHLFEDPADFLAAAGAHLAADPVLGTVVATIADRAVAGRVEQAPHHWWVVALDDAGEVSGVGMRTAPFAPYPLFLLPMPNGAAVELARVLHERGEQVGGVNGALPTARTCADELARLQGRRVEVSVHTRLHRLAAVTPPRPAPGKVRPAGDGDLDLVLQWFGEFAAAADEQAGRAPGSHHVVVEERQAMRARIAAGEVWLWVLPDGLPVHVTARHPASFGAARIGPVYTPPEHRGRGYAANAVAAVSQMILDAGAVPCLYTDQDNPTSNVLYASLGYRPVVDMVDLLVR